jgi:methanogenic corrinoid protein MtbC1
VRLPLYTFLEDVLLDLLRQVGRAWERGEATPAREHMISALVPEVLSWIGDRLPEPEEDAPLLVISTPAGTRHDLGARAAQLIARAEGWRTLFLGADLPAADIVRAAEENGAALVGLSVVFPVGEAKVARELESLVEAFSGRVGVVVGGAAASDYGAVLARPGVEIVGDLMSFRRVLATKR